MFEPGINFASSMKKFIIRLVLSQCILLLNGYSPLYANAVQGYSNSAVILKDSIKTIDSGEIIKSSVLCSGIPFKLEIAEIEEDKFSSFRKYLKRINSFTILYSDQTPGHFFGCIDKKTPSAKPLSERPSNFSYITFQVFRI